MSNINERRLERLFREYDTHQARMMSALQKIQHTVPLQPVILFASYARADATEESDVDFLVVEDDVPSKVQ